MASQYPSGMPARSAAATYPKRMSQFPVAGFPSRLIPAASWPVGLRGWTVTVFAALFGFALPVFLIAGNVEYVTGSDWLYSYNWWRNGIDDTTGITVQELNRGADQIKDYFQNNEELLDLRVNLRGEEVSLYSEREVRHMVDVKGLMKGVSNTVLITGLTALVIAIAGLIYMRAQFWGYLQRTLRWSALGSGLIVGVLGIAILIDFDFVFTQFHFISFANDLWQLNPYTDYLLIMFPQQFFFEATLMIAVMAVAQFAALYFAVSLIRGRLSRPRVPVPPG